MGPASPEPANERLMERVKPVSRLVGSLPAAVSSAAWHYASDRADLPHPRGPGGRLNLENRGENDQQGIQIIGTSYNVIRSDKTSRYIDG